MDKITLIATLSFGLEAVVKRELMALGFANIKASNGKVEFEATINTASETIGGEYPGVEFKKSGDSWEVFIPDSYKMGHEAHFAQVTEKFLQYLSEGKLPDWEVPNMITKYNLTTQALELALKTYNK